MHRLIRKGLLAAVLFGMVGSAPLASAEIYTVTGTGEYTIEAGTKESPAMAKERAKYYALRNAAEQSGIYLESVSEMSMGQLTKDEIYTLSAAILQVQGMPQFQAIVLNGDSIRYICTVKAQINTDSITPAQMAELKENLQRTQKMEDELDALDQEIEKLKKQYLNASDGEQREAIAEIIRENDKRFQAAQLVREGSALDNQKKYREAIAAYSKALELNPKSAGAYLDRGITYFTLQKVPQAISDMEQAVKLDPMDPNAYSNLATIYFAVGQYEKAVVNYNKCLAIEPRMILAYVNRGASYYKLGFYQNALSDYDKALELYPQSEDIQRQRAIVYKAWKTKN